MKETTMSTLMEDDIKRWTAKRKTALVLDIIQGKTTVSEASRAFDLSPSDVEQWVDEGKRGMENALRTKPLEVKEQYEKQLRELQEAYGEAMLELRATMPDVKLSPYPVATESLNARRWWKGSHTARRMIVEYCKYLAILGREAFLNLGPKDKPAETSATGKDS